MLPTVSLFTYLRISTKLNCNHGHIYLRRSISIPYMEYDAAREYAMHDTLWSREKNQNDSAIAASTTYPIIRPREAN